MTNERPHNLPPFPPSVPGHPLHTVFTRSREGTKLVEPCHRMFERMLKGRGLRNHATIQPTSGMSFDPGLSRFDFRREASGLVGATVDDFRPGCVVSITFQNDHRTLFASLFIEPEAKAVRGRLVRVGTQIPKDETGRPESFVARHETPGDVIVEETSVVYGDGELETATDRVADWLWFLVERELGPHGSSTQAGEP